MPVVTWLEQLDSNEMTTVDRDVAVFDAATFPLLDDEEVREHVAALSAHLTVVDDKVRQRVIGYSLYGRELDIIQTSITKAFCATECARPPLGCCNNQHWKIYSMSDIMMTRPTPVAMQLSDAIQKLQVDECAFREEASTAPETTRCRYFRGEGCTLRLFKSPLCMHYLCEGLSTRIETVFGEAGEVFVSNMRSVVARSLVRGRDFTCASVVASALPLLTADAANGVVCPDA